MPAANEARTVSAFTIRYREMPGDAERNAVESIVRQRGGRIAWQANPRFERTYALIEGVSDPEAVRAATRGTVLDSAVIALAVLPNVAEALPYLRDALCGEGRPAGIVACEPTEGGTIVEWDLERTGAEVILALIDVELRRFHAARVNELLSPLPLAWWTRIAANGLRAPQIAPDRVLEALLEQSDVAR
jgi:hypothetical protein